MDEVAFEAAKAPCLAHPEMMKRHRAIAEQPFGNLKARIFGNRRLLVRGLRGVRGEMALTVLAHNFKRMTNIPGIPILMRNLAQA